MWGRITNFTAQIDASFATVERDGSSQGGSDLDRAGGATPTSGDDKVGGGALLSADDQDGWGDDDDFGDELELDTGDEMAPENGVIASPLGEHHKALEKEGGEAHNDSDVDMVDMVAETQGPRTDSSLGRHAPDSAATKIEIPSEPGTDSIAQGERQEPIEKAQPPSALPQSLPELARQSSASPEVVTVSAPGKVLIAGGYLVLESTNPGVVLAADGCRFHTTVTFRPPHSEGGGVVSSSINASWESTPLDVHSPQFDRVFSYNLSYALAPVDGDVSLRLQPRMGPRERNKFVERTLLLALGYLRQFLGVEVFCTRLREWDGLNGGRRLALAVKLRADNNFYSQIAHLKERGLDVTPQNLERLDPFLPCTKDELTGELVINKTGMGSSAALVTSIVGALLRFFGAVSLPSSADGEGDDLDQACKTNGGTDAEKEGLRIAHNLSQLCHCHAQGKVGSGFDISSAVYGSHVYTRFTKGFINKFLEDVSLLAEGDKDGLPLSEILSEELVGLVNDVEWDCTVRPINLPPGLELVMADICGGSESPSMARNILEWKKNKRKVGFMDDYYWKDLKRCNKKVVSLLSDQFTSETFLGGLGRDGAMIISTRTAEQWRKPMPSSWHEFEGSSWDVAMKLLDLRFALLECRQNLKGMGKAAGVPVEPDEQTALADATMKLPGVIAAGVPGAGGYDALFAIYVKGPVTNDGKSDQVRDEIGKLWREMNYDNNERVVCPLSVRAAGSDGGLFITQMDW